MEASESGKLTAEFRVVLSRMLSLPPPLVRSLTDQLISTTLLSLAPNPSASAPAGTTNGAAGAAGAVGAAKAADPHATNLRLPRSALRRFLDGEFTGGEPPISIPSVRTKQMERMMLVMDILEHLAKTADYPLGTSSTSAARNTAMASAVTKPAITPPPVVKKPSVHHKQPGPAKFPAPRPISTLPPPRRVSPLLSALNHSEEPPAESAQE